MFGKKKKCIACGQPADENSCVHYEIKTSTNKTLGQMDVHKTMQCFPLGSTILREQHEGAIDGAYITSANKVHGKKYKFLLLRKKDFFEMMLYETLYHSKGTKYKLQKDTYNFLQEYVNDNTLIMVIIRILANKPELHIPLLVSIHDPIIPPELLEGVKHLERQAKAIQKLKTSMSIRGNNKIQEAQIMYQYLADTVITL